MSHTVTIIDSIKPAVVRKKYTMTDDVMKKTVIASITEGVGVSREITTAREFADLLAEVTESDSLVICAGQWMGANDKPFRIIPEEELARILNSRVGEVAGGVIHKDGKRISARLKRGITPSVYALFDADNPPGMPAAWAAMDIGARLRMWESILPGISSCERIELRGSSARVRREGEPGQQATHAWIKVSDASKIGLMKAHVGVEMVNRGLSFAFEKLSRSPKTKGKVIGIEHRSLFDLAVFDTGRLVFCAQPDVSDAPGYVCDDAAITIANEGGGILDLSFLTIPKPSALREYCRNTGIKLEIKATPNGGGLSVVSCGQLSATTEITRRGSTQTLAAWVDGLQPGEKLRCEAPFRESYSEAAFIRLSDSGQPFIYDVGNGTTYRIAEDWGDTAEGVEDFDGAASTIDIDAEMAGGPDTDTASESGPKVKPKPRLVNIRRVDAFAGEYEPAEYLIDYMLQSGFLYSLTAETGAGKTALMILVSALVATGKPFGEVEVKKGSVIYCVGENADEFRQRMICLRENSYDADEFNGIHVLTPEAHKGLLTERGSAEVAAYAGALGGVDLVVVDTAAAFFDGDEENSNTELGEYARRLRRRLCTLPGKPCVVVCSHPTKNAKTHEELVPRGGGAFVAEVDGNLTLMKKDVSASEMFWSKKFRGRIDNPVQIALTPVEAQRTRDAKGRPLRSVLAGVVEAEPVDPKAEQGLRDRIMTLMLDGKTRTVTDVAIGMHEMRAGETGGNGHPGWKRTNAEMGKLRKFKKPLLEETDKRWRSTTAGKAHANGLRGGPDAKPVTAEADVF